MMKAKIEKILQEKFHPKSLEVIDESHQHAGHNDQAKAGGTHFRLVIVSDTFTGKTRVEKHRMIYAALEVPIAEGVHAIAIHAKSPTEPTN